MITISEIQMYINDELNPKLKGIVRFFWFAYGSLNDDGGQLLLPMDHSDMVIRCKGAFRYSFGADEIIPDQVVFHGIRRKPVVLIQDGYNETFGISFEPWGLYPFINKEMSYYADKIINLSEVNLELNDAVCTAVSELKACETENMMAQLSSKIEEILISNLHLTDAYKESVSVLRPFYENDQINIEEFCVTHKISRRSLQRYFNKFVGVTPKELLNIRQFEDTSRDLIYQDKAVLSDVVYNGAYYDQAHFNKSFKKYSRHTPGEFKSKKPALKSKMKIEL